MTPRKLNVHFCFFSYAGTSTARATHPDVRDWFVRTMLAIRNDPRIGEVTWEDKADVPLHMVRNEHIDIAAKKGADVIVMCDSDMQPDCELKEDPEAQPFFQSSFDFLYKHYDRGPVCIASPYGGPPDFSNVYAFDWMSWNNVGVLNRPDMHLEPFTRNHAEILSGIQPAAAGPTGLIMWDMRAFSEVLKPPYHYYEYTDARETQKASTEDVTITRDFSMLTTEKLGYNGFFINWSAWSGHWKSQLVRKPRSIKVDHVNAKYREAVLANVDSRVRRVDIGELLRTINGRRQTAEANGRAAAAGGCEARQGAAC